MDERRPLVDDGVGPELRAHQDVGEAVAVDVPGAGHRAAQAGARLAGHLLVGGVRQEGARAVVDAEEPVILSGSGRSHDHVVEAVAVDVPCAGDGQTQLRAGLASRDGPGRVGVRAVVLAAVEEDPPLVGVG